MNRLFLTLSLIPTIFFPLIAAAQPLSSCGDILNPGEYYLTDDLTSSGTCFKIQTDDVVLDCQNHEIASDDDSGDGIMIDGYKNITLLNCNITDYETGIYVSDSTNISITNMNINVYDTGIYVDNVTNLSVEGLRSALGSEAIYVEDSRRVSLRQFELREFDVAVFFNNVTIGNITNGVINESYGDDMYFIALSNFTVDSVQIYASYANDEAFVSVHDSTNNTFLNIYIDDMWQTEDDIDAAFYIHNSDYNTFDGIFINHSANAGIYMENANHNVLTHLNLAELDYYEGIELRESNYNRIENIRLSQTYGIIIGNSEHNIIRNFTLIDGDCGIWIAASNSVFENGQIDRFATVGIRLEHPSVNNTFRNISVNNSGWAVDYYVSREPWKDDICRNTFEEIKYAGLPVLVINETVNISNMALGELAMCNASNSNLSDLQIGVSGQTANGILLVISHNVTGNNIEIINPDKAFFVEYSNGSLFSNVNIHGDHDGAAFYLDYANDGYYTDFVIRNVSRVFWFDYKTYRNTFNHMDIANIETLISLPYPKPENQTFSNMRIFNITASSAADLRDNHKGYRFINITIDSAKTVFGYLNAGSWRNDQFINVTIKNIERAFYFHGGGGEFNITMKNVTVINATTAFSGSATTRRLYIDGFTAQNCNEGMKFVDFLADSSLRHLRLYNNNQPFVATYPENVLIADSEIYNNTEGMFFFSNPWAPVSHIKLDHLYVHDNHNYGVYISYPLNNEITNSVFENNGIYQLVLNSSGHGNRENRIYNNKFIAENGAGVVYDNGDNAWNTTLQCGVRNIIDGPCIGGNYYSDYQGKDDDHNGIGDVPYVIEGGANKDFLPLVVYVPPKHHSHNAKHSIIFPQPLDASCQVNETVNVTLYITNDGDYDESLSIEVSGSVPYGVDNTVLIPSGETKRVILSLSPERPGRFKIEVRVYNDYISVEQSFYLRVTPPPQPSIEQISVEQTEEEKPATEEQEVNNSEPSEQGPPLYVVDGPSTTMVGKEISFTITANGKPAANAQINLTLPNGTVKTLYTDGNGVLSFIPPEPGEYHLYLPNGNFVFHALKGLTPPPQEKGAASTVSPEPEIEKTPQGCCIGAMCLPSVFGCGGYAAGILILGAAALWFGMIKR